MSDPTPVPESKLERIRKLLDKAGSTEYPQEAAALTERAVTLMAEYGVTEMMLRANEKPDPHRIVERVIALNGPYGRQKVDLATGIADALGCRTWYHRRGKLIVSVTIVGFDSDAVRVEMLFTHLLVQATRGLVGADNPDPTRVGTRTFRTSWLDAFAVRVCARLREAEARARGDYERATGTGTALVLADRAALVQRFIDAKELRKIRKRRLNTGAGYAQGWHAGDRADIGGGKLDATATRLIGERR